jgi:hypothetical protein
MPTNSAWLGQNDTGGAYIAPSLLYSGTKKALGWIGANDTAGAWIPSSLLYEGTLKQLGWLGQLDTAGAWIPASLVYWQDTGLPTNPLFPPAPVPPSESGIVPPLFGGFFGLTWLKNVAVLTRDYWDESLTTPYSGQLFPVPNSGGTTTGQIYPY